MLATCTLLHVRSYAIWLRETHHPAPPRQAYSFLPTQPENHHTDQDGYYEHKNADIQGDRQPVDFLG